MKKRVDSRKTITEKPKANQEIPDGAQAYIADRLLFTAETALITRNEIATEAGLDLQKVKAIMPAPKEGEPQPYKYTDLKKVVSAILGNNGDPDKWIKAVVGEWKTLPKDSKYANKTGQEVRN